MDLLTESARSYDEEDVSAFLERFDRLNLERIGKRLDEATTKLRQLPEQERGISSLMSSHKAGLYAIFETLNSDVALREEAFLDKKFNPIFLLVQTNRLLKVRGCPPAFGYFSFQANPDRNWYAMKSLHRLQQNITATDFEWSIREPLTSAMARVQLSNLDAEFLKTFWPGVYWIVRRLDADLITHSLRALEFDVCKLALDHLQVDSDGFRDLLLSVNKILDISPRDFWEAMGTTPASVWIEQFSRSKALWRLMQKVEETEKRILPDLFNWALPFVNSMQPIQAASACRALVDFLLHKIQTSNLPDVVKVFCSDFGIQILVRTMDVMSTGQISNTLRATIRETLEFVCRHTSLITKSVKRSDSEATHCAELLSTAIALDVQCLSNDRDLLSQNRHLPEHACTISTMTWQSACNGLGQHNSMLAQHLICGFKGLVGVEKLHVSEKRSSAPDAQKFNAVLDEAHGFVVDTLERMNEFDASVLQELLEQKDQSNALIYELLSSSVEVRSAAVDLIKTITGQSVRNEALDGALRSYFGNILDAFSSSLTRIAAKATFAPASSMLQLCKDILDILCNSSNGLLRASEIEERSMEAAEHFWQALWQELRTIFASTEQWADQGQKRDTMVIFCGEVMEFAGILFDQFAVFAGALSRDSQNGHNGTKAGQRLTEQPKSTLPTMVKFLRLRDDFLLSKSTALVCDVLRRLKQYDATVEEDALKNIENVINGTTRTVLTINQKAELHRALEEHLGESIGFGNDEVARPQPLVPKTRPGTIDMEKWRSIQTERPASNNLKSIQGTTPAQKNQHSMTAKKKPTMIQPVGKADQKGDPTEFARKRQQEMLAKKKRDQEAIARERAKMGGSALSGLGVSGKDHSAPKGSGILVSSDEESDDSDVEDMDKLLFGGSDKSASNSKAVPKIGKEDGKGGRKRPHHGPVKKQRLVRSAKDMRARLAPDLAPLHKQILSWDPNHDAPFPPKASAKDYAAVLSTFHDPFDYQNTFQPLLLLEAWNGFLKAKDENTASSIEMKINSRSSVDAFSEVSASIEQRDAKEVMEGDIVMISKSRMSISDDHGPKCLSRVAKIIRKKTHIEIVCRVMPDSSVTRILNPNGTAYFTKIMSIVPLEREYGALLGLEYYDLCEEITHARPSPLLSYKDETLAPLQRNYDVNKAQAKAIKSALDNDAFTLIQGPPGSGKTKTIVAIVGALLTSGFNNPTVRINSLNGQNPQNGSPLRKMLVCAPSNAAVDELVMRFKGGVKTTDGQDHTASIVRLGRSDAINSNVQDVTLDELVDKRLNVTSVGKAREDTQKIMRQHQEASEKLKQARSRLDKEDTEENRRSVGEHKKAMALLSQKVDQAKDNEGVQSRQADLNRRKAQQEVIEEANIICATLSGSGHDLFQNLNVEFETVVIDEAAQCVELSALIPLKYGCAKCVLVGDPQQLPPTVFSKEAANFKYEQSLFVRMQSNHKDAVHLLDTQYRMHPEISSFPSHTFYSGLLRDGPDMAKQRTRPWHAADLTGPFQFFDVQGEHSVGRGGHSLVNQAEVRVAIKLYRRLTKDFKIDFTRKIGIITPYKSQVRELKSQFRANFGDEIVGNIEFSTTDAFQGRESEIIIFSCVRASPTKGIGFLQDIRRMNVGLTRAKSSLWVLGNSESLVRGRYWEKLVKHAQNNGHFVNGNIEGLLSRPLNKTRNVNPSSAGEKMPEIEYGIGSDDEPPKSVASNTDLMDVDTPDTIPSRARAVRSEDMEQRSRQSSVPAKRKHGEAEEALSKIKGSTHDSSSEKRHSADVEMKDMDIEQVGGMEKRHEETPKAATGGNITSSRPLPKKPAPRKKEAPSVFMPKKPRR